MFYSGRKFLWGLLVLILLCPLIVFADTSKRNINIYFFHSDSCSHCQSEEDFLLKIEKNYSNVKVYRLEIHNEENMSIFEQVKRIYHITSNAVPVTIIGSELYTGFKEDRSSSLFVRTIEYYSIYPYEDRVLEVIDHSYDAIPVIKQDVPSLKEFMNHYKNYDVMGVHLDYLDVSTVAILMGFFSSINIISILSIVIVLCFLLTRIGGGRDKILLLIFYFVCLGSLRVSSVIRNDMFHLVIYALLFILFMIGLFFYYKNKRRQYFMMDFIIFISFCNEYLSRRFFGKYLTILKDTLSLHLLDGVEKIVYYSHYFVSIIMVDLLLVLIVYLFLEKKLIKN